MDELEGVLRISFVAESSTQDPLNKKQRCRNAIIFVLNQGRGEVREEGSTGN